MKVNKFYIDGTWTTPSSNKTMPVINPANLETHSIMACATETDVNDAAAAAHRAFPGWAGTSGMERSDFMLEIADKMESRKEDFVEAHVQTMGIPRHLAYEVQIEGPIQAVRYYADLARKIDSDQDEDGFLLAREPIGVCALINPWNYPLLQMVGKVAPALAAGCTMIVKPAEQTPIQDIIMAEIVDSVGLPGGVFNLLTGVGSEIGPKMSSHPLVDMVSFTGSTSSGISVAMNAAPTIKRVCQEMGGKSAFIIGEGADLQAAIKYGVDNVMLNTGQTCDALTRMLVPRAQYQEAIDIATRCANEHVVGDPNSKETTVGPLASMIQRERVVDYIQKGIDSGAKLLIGGNEFPKGLSTGAYISPTVFADVDREMVIAKEEIFGPVLCMLAYDSIDEAVEIANELEYGLSSAVWAENTEEAVKIAHRLRAGQCFIQGSYFRLNAPFGGYKGSGNGREWGEAGLSEYQELKAIVLPD